jgi:phage shock protein E
VSKNKKTGSPSATEQASGGSASASKTPRNASSPPPRRLRPRDWALIVGGVVALFIIVVSGWVIASGGSTKPAVTSDGAVVQANGGTWTNITPDKLASMLDHKDFTLLNVKTPYIGEIAGTDLYVPYDQVAARAAELPTDKTAKIVVYCRSGHESAIAAQTLIDLGYTSIDNLDGGMTAWTDSGRSLVQLPRS